MADCGDEKQEHPERAAGVRRVGLAAVLLAVTLGAMYWALYDVPGRWHAGRAASVEVTLLDFRNDHRPDAVIREPRTVDRLAERLRWRRVLREVDVCIPWQWQVRFLDDGGRELLRLKVSAQGAYATNEDSAGLYYAAGAPLADLLSEETGMPGMEP